MDMENDKRWDRVDRVDGSRLELYGVNLYVVEWKY